MEDEKPELPLLERPRNPRQELVDTAEALEAAVEILTSEAGWFAVDAERASGFKYSNRAYLLQISRGNSPLYLVDPAAIAPELSAEPFAELAQIMQSDTWILHAATQDLPCLNQLGLIPTSLFDTELAGRLLGLPRVGLGAMVEHFLQVRLAKEHSAVDWSIRPFHSDWLNYAALDIDVLHELALKVQASLIEAEKLDWAKEEFAALVKFKPKPPKPDRWRGVSGLHEIKDQRALAVARELWIAREQLGIRLDASPGRVIPDAAITAVAKELPKTRSQLANQKSFIGRGSRTYLDIWWEALQKGLNTNDLPPLKLPLAGIPNHRNWSQRFPEAEARLNVLKPVMQMLAEQAQMPAENLLTPDYLRTLAWQPPEDLAEIEQLLANLGARAWQIQICAEPFRVALQTLREN